MHGLDKVAHVLHVAGPASVRGIGRPIVRGISPQSTALSPLAPLPSAGHRAQRLRHWKAGFPCSRRLSRPWPRLLRLGIGLNAFGIGRTAFRRS